MKPIVPRSVILERAQRAVESGQPVHQIQPWPIGTAAGRAFVQEVVHLQNLRDASKRVQEECYV